MGRVLAYYGMFPIILNIIVLILIPRASFVCITFGQNAPPPYKGYFIICLVENDYRRHDRLELDKNQEMRYEFIH